MRSIAALAISLIVGLSLATPPAWVGAQQTTPIDYTAPVCNLCAFEVLLHVTGQQSILLLPQDARIIKYTRIATVTHCTKDDATCPEVNCIPGVSATVDASGSERESTSRNGDIQTMFAGRNLFPISAENLMKWNVLDLAPGFYLISGQVTKTFHQATGTEEYEPSPDAALINLCELIDWDRGCGGPEARPSRSRFAAVESASLRADVNALLARFGPQGPMGQAIDRNLRYS